MNKIISLVAGALLLSSTAVWADSYVAENKGDFVTAWNVLGKNVGQQDTIIVAADMGGLNMNTTNGPLAGALVYYRSARRNRQDASARSANCYRYLCGKFFQPYF